MHSPIMRMLGMASWVITALASINIGTCVMFGFDIFKTDFVMMNMPGIIAPAYYIIGLAGAFSFALFIMACMGTCPKCCKSPCKC